jgi:hypothetical protein
VPFDGADQVRRLAVARGRTRGACVTVVLLVSLVAGAFGPTSTGHDAEARHRIRTAAAPAETTTTPATTTTTPTGPVLTPYPTTTIVDWGNYHPSYNTVAQLYADSNDLVFIATVDPFVANDPGPGATFAPFDLTTATFLASPPTPPDIILGVPQGQPGDVPLLVGHTYLVFFGIDTSVGTEPQTCIVGGQRGLFDYDRATQTVTRTDANASSQIPRTLTLAQMTAEIRAAQAATPTDVGSSTDPEKWPPPPVCALSATGG